MLQNPAPRHPELLWRELARLAGSLLTFSLQKSMLSVAPPFPARAKSAGDVFPPPSALLVELLEASLPSRVVAIELTQERQFWQMVHCRMFDCVKALIFTCRVRSDLPAHVLLTQFPQLCKAGSRADVSDVPSM